MARQEIKKRRVLPRPVDEIVKDVSRGVGELRRQSGAAVERIKEGYRKIKKATR